MVSGILEPRNNIYHVVLYWQENRKQKFFSFTTKIKVKGKDEKLEANIILLEARKNFDPKNIAKMKEKYQYAKPKKIEIGNIPEFSVSAYYEWAYKIYTSINPQLSTATSIGYENSLKKVMKYKPFNFIKFMELKKKHIESFFEYLMIVEKLKPSTVNQMRVFMTALYTVAINHELVKYNLISQTKAIKIKKVVKNHLNKEEIKILLNEIDKNDFKLEYYLLLFLGLRKSELLGLKIADINFSDTTLSLNRSIIWGNKREVTINNNMKSFHAHRKFPLNWELEKLLRERIDRINHDKKFFGKSYGKIEKNGFDPKEFICVDREGNLLKRERLNNELKKIIKKCNISYVTVHELRHTCATLMYEAGIDLKKIQYWLGHSNISTTANIYAHYDNSNNTQTIEILEKSIKK